MNSVLIFFTYIPLIVSQSCREYGMTCSDDNSCCGGCCISGICKDTYSDCRVLSNQCIDFYCPPNEECYIYQPEDCKGCASFPICINSPPAPLEILLPNYIPTTATSGYRYSYKKSISMLIVGLALMSKIF
ncbi:unnamed protein product [Diabrotica balteata]|uniref:Uncharacterized protein n=1 Tax=Diabrotica balteata TaxID=107213 RepID=A0A9N9XDD6_DIABA|nr:unnamed protein product [Diabrotica balteata]